MYTHTYIHTYMCLCVLLLLVEVVVVVVVCCIICSRIPRGPPALMLRTATSVRSGPELGEG